MPGTILVIRINSPLNPICMNRIPSGRGPLYSEHGFMLPDMFHAGMYA
jgi:hypothetical protein